MKTSACKIVLVTLLLPLTAAPQASAPSKVNPRATTPAASPQTAAPATAAHPVPSPTPTPPKVNPALASAPIVNGPKYSPTQLDFGAVDYNASTRRTFSLTVPLAGEVTLEFPAGSFVLAESRRTQPMNLGQGPSQMKRAQVPPMKPVPAFSNNQTETYKWIFVAGEELQLDILFAPLFSKNNTPGMRTATMKFSGPGSITPWTIIIPMRGTLNGSKVDLTPQLTQPPIGNKSMAGADPVPTGAGRAALPGALSLAVLQKKTAPKGRNSRVFIAHGTILSIINGQQNAAKAIRASRAMQIPPSKPMSAPGNSAGNLSNDPGKANTKKLKTTPTPNPMGQASMAEVVPCVATTKIRLVDGKYKGVVFTPIIPKSNGNYEVPQHVIQGCYFGQQQGSAYLFGNFKKGQLPLNINYWSDSEIDAALDPNLEGELDEDNVTLVVKLADGTQLKATGFKFYAARGEPIPLHVIPSYSYRAKEGTGPTSFVSPLANNDPGAYLARDKWQLIPRTGDNRCDDPVNSSTLTKGSDAGVDYYDFGKLAQGFTTDSYSSVYWYNSANSCRSALNVDTNSYCNKGPSVTPGDNMLDVQWDGDNIRVGWRTQLCAWGGWEYQNGTWNRVFDVYSMSRYALTVYVVGPKGVKPWADGKQ